MSAKPMMCATPECSLYGQRRTVMGGCEECFQPLVPWVDPDAPTIEQIAYIVCDVAELEGKPVPRLEIERILRSNRKLHDEWIARLSEIDWRHRLNEIHIADAIAMGS